MLPSVISVRKILRHEWSNKGPWSLYFFRCYEISTWQVQKYKNYVQFILLWPILNQNCCTWAELSCGKIVFLHLAARCHQYSSHTFLLLLNMMWCCSGFKYLNNTVTTCVDRYYIWWHVNINHHNPSSDKIHITWK